MAYSNEQIIQTKQRLQDLRLESKLSRKELMQQLWTKENFKISDTMLGKYEYDDKLINPEKYLATQKMSLDTFVALADFYHVPVEYLLGRSSTRNPDNLQLGKDLHLSDHAIANIRALIEKDNHHISDKEYIRRSDILSQLLSDSDFLILIECIAKGKEYLIAQENYDIQKFIDVGSDYTEDDLYIKEVNQHDAHVIDCDYANTGEFYFFKATQMLNSLIRNLLSPYLLDRYIKPTLPSLSPEECSKLLASFNITQTD